MPGLSLTPSQDQEVTFESGVGSDGALAAQSFWTWNGDQPATYGAVDYETKYGERTAGQGSGVISFSFDAASHWTAPEESAFKAAMALWSSVANVHFQEADTAADFTIIRGTDGEADAGATRLQPGVIGGTTLGRPVEASLSIDTSVPGFGPVGAAFDVDGGYPWLTLEHELGHILGLGHTGAYDEGVTSTTPSYGPYDSLAYSIMSYIDPNRTTGAWSEVSSTGARVEDVPVTPQLIDIAALQRIYGLPIDTPLSGGQTFGFNTNIQGPIASFFDFTQNTHPIVTLWDAGSGNTLDLSGFAQGSTVNLTAGAASNVGGLTNNLTIALGVRIDAVVGGAGADYLTANADGDTLIGGDGADHLTGGGGADLVFGGLGDDYILGGAAASTVFGGKGDDRVMAAGYLSGDAGDDTLQGGGPQDTLLGGPGDDSLSVGGHGWAFGNQGNDSLFGVDAATLFGGQGDDHLSGSSNGGMFFGNLGDDVIQVSGAASVYGGQGNDWIQGSQTTAQYLSGDLGDDTISGGGGADTIVGGPGADTLTGDKADPDPYSHVSLLPASYAGAHAGDLFVYRLLTDSAFDAPDRITDFNPAEDRVDITAIDAARAASGQVAFHWVDHLDGRAGEAALAPNPHGANTLLLLDADGDGVADFKLILSGALSQGDWLHF